MSHASRWATALAWLLVIGCGKAGNPQGRLPYSGTVTVDGQPMPSGYFNFEPKGGQKTQSGGVIENGKFDVPEARGAAPGLYAVAIFSSTAPPAGKYEPGTPEYEAAASRMRPVILPKEYNINSTLTREIKADDDNVFEFELSTKKK